MSAPGRYSEAERLTLTVSGAVFFGYVVSLALKYFGYAWIVDARGRPVLEDFVTFRAAGALARHGAALSAYDPHLQHLAEAAVVGHGFDGLLGWAYPPAFLFVAAALASLPYRIAFLGWIVSTFALYAAVAGAIARRALAVLVAAAAPWVVTALLPGQNGFLTAALIGIVLVNLEKRSLLAGVALGLLSYKPQFGILFPLALAAGGYWRAFAAATITALTINAAAVFVFGTATAVAFLHMLSGAAASHLATDGLGWNKLLSIYGLVHALGAPGVAAMLAQILIDIALAAGVAVVWRSDVAYSLKAAFLAAAVPLATPYVLIYDLPVLAIAIAFLYRARGFDRIDFAALAVATPFLYPLPDFALPLPVFASVAVLALAVRRLYAVLPRMRISPSWATDATSLPSSE